VCVLDQDLFEKQQKIKKTVTKQIKKHIKKNSNRNLKEWYQFPKQHLNLQDNHDMLMATNQKHDHILKKQKIRFFF